MPRSFLTLVLAAGFYAGLPASHAAVTDDYLSELQTQAHSQALQDAPEWRALLHYRTGALQHGYVSEAETLAFFLAADGRSNPGDELDATLAGFFQPAPAGDPDQAVQCRFVARYQWLKQRLHLDAARLPEQPCPGFARWYADIDPGALVLVFPAAYLNNPASMYGHSFLRFNRAGRGEEARLEAIAVNFSADITGGEGLAAAYKGLFGLYRGSFQMEPYYQMVREYSDIENRDIWEYQLDYTPAELRRLVEHLWELRQVKFRYYFFDRNCSYALLALLDVARPDTPLTARFTYQVIPADALQAALSQPGALVQRRYLPSLATRLHARLSAMNSDDRRSVLALLDHRLEPGAATLQHLPAERQAAIYDTVSDRLLYGASRGDLLKDDYAPLMAKLLQARAQLQEPDLALSPPDTDPALGHPSMRASLGAGSSGGVRYMQVGLRGAYHDLLDPSLGFATGASIAMLDAAARRDSESGHTRLEYLKLFEVMSLTPSDLFYRSLSWDLGAGWDRRWLGRGKRPLLGDAHGGAGLSYSAGQSLLLYGVMDARLLTGGGITGGYTLGIDPHLGLVWRAGNRVSLGMSVEAQHFPDHLHATLLDYTAAANVSLSRGLSVRLSWSRQGEPTALEDETGLALLWYF